MRHMLFTLLYLLVVVGAVNSADKKLNRIESIKKVAFYGDQGRCCTKITAIELS